jgi:hypothetical protein
MAFEQFSDDARIWLYQANRELSSTEQSYLARQLAIFVDQWSAHGKKLTAESSVLDEYRVAICAEGNVEASGCSIDALVRFMKEIGAELGVDFFDRLKILVEKDGKKELISFSNLRQNLETIMFHPAILTVKELKDKSKLRVKEYLSI